MDRTQHWAWRVAPVVALAGAFCGGELEAGAFNPTIPKRQARAEVVDFARIPAVDGRAARVSELDVTPGGEIYVVDQWGPMYFVSSDGESVTEYLDLRKVRGVGLTNNSEAGFQSAAFHPDFEKVGTAGYGRFYTISTSAVRLREPDFNPRSGDTFDTVLLEWRCADPAGRPFSAVDPRNPFREVLRIRQPYGNHNGGLIAFNPNSEAGSPDFGMLYAGIADGGAGGDPQKMAQDLGFIFAKIIRIDPLGSDAANGRYGIPTDNPYAGSERGGVLPEIWASGLRNPQRFRWDRAGEQRMFIADIGQGAVEEINVGVAGANYGWNVREGDFEFLGSNQIGANRRSDSAVTGFSYPIAQYGHDGMASVTTGTVYRGGGLPGLEGKLIFGDMASGRIFFIDADRPLASGSAPITELRLMKRGMETSFLDLIRETHGGVWRAQLRFGSDARGRIYLLNKDDGIIRRLASAEP